jgi:hypothetical protein
VRTKEIKRWRNNREAQRASCEGQGIKRWRNNREAHITTEKHSESDKVTFITFAALQEIISSLLQL